MGTEANRYPDVHPKGDYRLKVISHAIVKPDASDKRPYLQVKVEVVGPSKGTIQGIRWGAHRFVRFFFTDLTIDKTRGWLKAAGFQGQAAQLDPEHPQKISLAGFEFNGSNAPEKSQSKNPKYAGKMQDKFDAYPAGGNANAWIDKVKRADVMQFAAIDALLGSAISTPVQETRPAQQQPAQAQANPAQQGQQAPDEVPFGNW